MLGLTAMAGDERAGAAGFAARRALIAIPALMWGQALRLWLHFAASGSYPEPGFAGRWILDSPIDLAMWGVREIAWWLLIAFLMVVLLAFFRESLAIRLVELGFRSNSGASA